MKRDCDRLIEGSEPLFRGNNHPVEQHSVTIFVRWKYRPAAGKNLRNLTLDFSCFFFRLVTVDTRDTEIVIKGNAGQFGFYRVNYDDQGWKNLMRVLSINHTVSITPYHPLIRTCEARVRDHGACALISSKILGVTGIKTIFII